MKSISQKRIRKQRAFPAIHRRIRELDMHYSEVADQMDMPVSTFYDKMSGRIPWRETEMQRLLDEIAQPEETMADFFPRRKVSA